MIIICVYVPIYSDVLNHMNIIGVYVPICSDVLNLRYILTCIF